MAGLKLLKTEYPLYEQLASCPSVLGKRIDFLHSFLSSLGIQSLEDVSLYTLKSFLNHVHHEFAFSPKQYSAYKGDLETVIFSHMKIIGHPFTKTSFADSVRSRKALIFLYVCGIESFSEIKAETRKAYEEYVSQSVPAKETEYIKAFDNIVLSEIEKITIKRTPSYKNELFFIGYYPDIDVAKKLYYTARKEFLYFDFSLPASTLMKKQIFTILLHDIERIGKIRNHYLLQQFITPLYHFYDFCFKHGIEDIKKISEKEASELEQYLINELHLKQKSAIQVLYRARKYLFLSDVRPDFESYVWFLERFSLYGRANPTRNIDCFYFGDISEPNRIYFQHYMRYLLILSPKYSLRSLLDKYYVAKDFINFLEQRNCSLTDISYADIEDYIVIQDAKNLKPETYNKTLLKLSFFLTVISVREDLLIPSFPFEYFYKKASYLHHDRSVPEDTIDRILDVLFDFPETLGLMYLTLYCTGLRINEVCSLKKDALSFDHETCWLKVYQYKMKSEKQIPIPDEISRLLKRHISEDTSDSVYVFPSCRDKDKPYQAATFVKQMKAQLLLYDQTKDITFRSHDYRHTIATDLHTSGAKLGTTRAFLGHTKEDMTKQYIDHLPGRIDKLQTKYFKEHNPYETDV